MDLEQPDEARGSDEEGETQDEPEHAMGELDGLNLSRRPSVSPAAAFLFL